MEKELLEFREKLKQKAEWKKEAVLIEYDKFSKVVSEGLKKVQQQTGTAPQVDRKRFKVDTMKKCDVVYIQTFTSTHYMLVHKVDGDTCHGVIISSKDKAHSMHEIQKDRAFLGNFATNSYMSSDLDEAKKQYVKVYENRREVDEIFRKVKKYYKDLLNIK